MIARVLAAVVVAAVVACASCSRGTTPQDVVNILAPTPTLTLNATDVFLEEGRMFQVIATSDGQPADVDWQSDKPEVVTVGADGTVRCLTPGGARITAVLRSDRSVKADVYIGCARVPAVLEVTKALEFEHVVGKSSCAQFVGHIRIRRVGGGTPGPLYVSSAHEALDVRPQEVVMSGDEATVEVFFNCSRRGSFEGRIEVEDAASGQVHTVTVVARITG